MNATLKAAKQELTSVFWETGLDEILKSRGIAEIIITGVMTNCCCETTARDAFMRDYRVFFCFGCNSYGNLGTAHRLIEESCLRICPCIG